MYTLRVYLVVRDERRFEPAQGIRGLRAVLRLEGLLELTPRHHPREKLEMRPPGCAREEKAMQVVRRSEERRKGGGTAVGGCVPEEAGDEVVDGFRGVLHGHLRQRRPQGQLLQYTSKCLKQNKVGVALTVQ